MIKLTVDKLKSGMVTEAPIITKQGQTIAKAGTVLNNQLIARLKFYRINEVEIDEASLPDNAKAAPTPMRVEVSAPEQSEPEAPASEKPVQKPAPKREKTRVSETMSYSQKLQSDAKFQTFQMNYTENLSSLHWVFESILAGKTDISYSEILENTRSLFKSKTSIELFDMLHFMRAIDDSVYAHSLNVALISRAIGKWLKLPKDELDELTVAGLLHDVGKLKIPKEVLEKTGRLTDEEFALIKSHPLEGRKLLKACGFSNNIQYAALQHHERSDGSGYPRGLESDEIDDFAAIIAIADVYDAMTCARSYRNALCAFQVIAEFEKDGLQKYNTKYILTFLERIAASYQNSMVMLSDGRKGRVVYLNKSRLSKPIIQDENDEVIDLSREHGVTITTII